MGLHRVFQFVQVLFSFHIRLAKILKVFDVIEFVGEKKNPYPYILHSDLFSLRKFIRQWNQFRKQPKSG